MKNGKMAGLRSIREGRSPAESRPGTCRLVRPGAARESGTEAHRYRGVKCPRFGAEMRVVPRKGVAFRPQCRDGRLLLCSIKAFCAKWER